MRTEEPTPTSRPSRSPITQPGYRRGQRPGNYRGKFPGELYEPEDVLALLAAIPATTTGLRDGALFAVLWRTGMRISEALNLRPSDLHESTGYIRIRRGRKSDRGRDVQMIGSAESPTYAWDQLRPWMERREALGIERGAPVFCVHSLPSRGKRLGDAQVRDALKAYVARSGLPGRWHLHGFRHTLAAELYRGGVKLATVRQQLGHSSLAVTQAYLESTLGIPEAMDELARFHPTWHADPLPTTLAAA
jgi:site-specific recombinase XerD